MLLTLANPRFLYSFVTSFVIAYTCAYISLASSGSPPPQHPTQVSALSGPATSESPVVNVIEEIVVVQEPVTVVTLDLTDYRAFPTPTGNGSYQHYEHLLGLVSSATGVNHTILARFVSLESSFDQYATPGGGDSAKGLFQFIDDTWIETVNKHGKRFNIDHTTSVWDARANALMAAMRLKDAVALLESHVNDRDITETDLYLTHFLGRTGAVRFLKADPGAIAAHAMPAPARRNKNIFYADGRRARHARTYNEVYTELANRFENKAREFGLS